MTATANNPSPGEPTNAFRPGLIARSIAVFSGGVGQAIKIALLSISNALAVYASYVLVSHSRWPVLAAVIAGALLIDWFYLAPRSWTLPAKFLIPGTIFLIAFQLLPIAYTIDIAFSNYSTGHILTKAQAVGQIKITSLEQPANGRQFDIAVARDGSGHLVLLMHQEGNGKLYVGTTKGLEPLPAAGVKLGPSGAPASAPGYTILQGAALFALDTTLRTFKVPTSGDAAIEPQGTSLAVELRPTLVYSAAGGTFTRISDGKVFRDNGRGSFVAGADELEPGWKTATGFANFDKIIHDPLVRTPFLSIFVWTFIFAGVSVFASFAVGLFLAIALDKRGMRLQRFYRSVVVIPYAIPSFLSLLVWAGLLNDDFGVVNHIFHTHIPWLFDSNWARVSCILVNIWLTTPYFFLVSMGALQSIPAELTEAGRVDGGGPFQLFRRVTLPLLLVAVAPLMIASFAFNFNNFNTIYLLTGGGPFNGSSSIAGSTDILISYTYKIASAAGKGNDYGLASAMAIVIFFIVATISGISFWRTKSLETMQ